MTSKRRSRNELTNAVARSTERSDLTPEEKAGAVERFRQVGGALREARRLEREDGARPEMDAIRRLVAFDPQEARAMELEFLGMDSAAHKIRSCGVPTRRYGPRRCRLRFCPNCAVVRSRQLARRIDFFVGMMECPTLTLWTHNTSSLSGLRAAIAYFRKSITALRKQKSAARMTRAVGTLEVKRQNNHPGWLVHGHIIVNMGVSDAEARAIDGDWRALVKGRGSFQVQRDKPMVDRTKRKGLCRYMAK